MDLVSKPGSSMACSRLMMELPSDDGLGAESAKAMASRDMVIMVSRMLVDRIPGCLMRSCWWDDRERIRFGSVRCLAFVVLRTCVFDDCDVEDD